MAGFDQAVRVTGTRDRRRPAHRGRRPRPARPLVGRAGLGPDRARADRRRLARRRPRACRCTAIRPAGATHHDQERSPRRSSTATPSRTSRARPPCVDAAAVDHLRRRRPPARAPASSSSSTRRATRGAPPARSRCGTTLDLGRLRLDCAFFRWRMEGRDRASGATTSWPAPSREPRSRPSSATSAACSTTPLIETFAALQERGRPRPGRDARRRCSASPSARRAPAARARDAGA